MSDKTFQDQFFEDEEELARAQAEEAPRTRPSAPSDQNGVSAAAPQGGTRKPPSFGMVVAIALVALVLGFGLGYFAAMSVVDKESPTTDGSIVSSMGSSSSSESNDALSSVDASEGMPEGHPDLSQFMNADGSVNEEALEEYRAERAAESGEDEADASSEESSAAETTEGEAASSESTAD